MTEEKVKITQNPIIFRMGEETGVVIEKSREDFEHSLFKEQYRQAFSIMDDLLQQPIMENADESSETTLSNIIAFCGNRGEGKTSALSTVRRILMDNKTFDNAIKANLFPHNTIIKPNSFKVLRMVDPSFFDNKHNLLELLIGQMYAEVLRSTNDKVHEAWGMNESIAKRNRLMQCFQKVQSSLFVLNNQATKSAYDNLEDVDELAAGIELAEKVNKLLRNYADYFEKERVLICIDDLDLNPTEGYKLAEEIRKYLSSQRACVVLIATKAEQLVEVVQSYLRQKISDIIENNVISEMADRYVAKLIPQGRRIILPKGEEIVEFPVELRHGTDTPETFMSIKEAVVHYIFWKTRYIFVNGRNISPIVPTNLRSIRHLLGMLYNMGDATREHTITNLENREAFKTYFFNIWTKELLDRDQAFVKSLVRNEDIISINKSVVMHLRIVLFPTDAHEEQTGDKELDAIINPLNAMQNVSLGDVFYALSFMENLIALDKEKKLIFFIRAFYSIKLYETYNVVSESEANLFPDNSQDKVSVYKYDSKLKQLNLLQRLVCGSYFNYEAGQLIPNDKRHIPRDRRIINGTQLIQLFKTLRNATDTDAVKDNWRLCEFFALTTTYPVYAGQGTEFDRTLTSRSYIDYFGDRNNYIVFDALSIFYNIINIKHTYQRWNDVYNSNNKGEKQDFFLDSLKNNDSLLNRILDMCKGKHWTPKTNMEGRYHSLISSAVIRFSEVQLSILDALRNERNTAKTGGDIYNLRSLYQTIREIGISVYPLKEDDELYPMPFWFLQPIIDYLVEVKESTFISIYQVDAQTELSKTVLENIFGKTLKKWKKEVIVSGDTIQEDIMRLPNADLLDAINWNELFEKDEEYMIEDIYAILSQPGPLGNLREIGISIKTREDTLQKALKQTRQEVSKLQANYTKELGQHITKLLQPVQERMESLEKSIEEIINSEKAKTEKKKTTRPKKKASEKATDDANVVVA